MYNLPCCLSCTSRVLPTYYQTPLPCNVNRRQRVIHRVGPVAVAEMLPLARARHHVVKVRPAHPQHSSNDVCAVPVCCVPHGVALESMGLLPSYQAAHVHVDVCAWQ